MTAVQPRADAGYGDQPRFLDGLEDRRLPYVVGVPSIARFRIADEVERYPGDEPPPPYRGIGRRRKAKGLRPGYLPPFESVPGLHGDEAVMEIQVYAEPRRQPLLPDARRQDLGGHGAKGCSRTSRWPSAGRRETGAAGPAPPPLPRRTTPNVRPSWRVMVASKRPLRWNSTCERRPSMPGESDAASR